MSVTAAVRSHLAPHPSRQHYSNAPIVETVLEIVVEAKQTNILSHLRKLGSKEPAYAEVREAFAFLAELGLDVSGATTSSGRRELVGYQFVDVSNARLFTARKDRFSYSKLQPYSEWETVRAEAARLWDRYKAAVKVHRITRIGVRYVNRLDLPGPSLELKDWLLTGPEVAPGMHQRLAGFAMELLLPQPDLQGTVATIRQAVLKPTQANAVSVALDVDVHRSGKGIDIKDIWSEIEILHERENLIFECSITDRLRDRIR
jgi:uncharacterized protein (TIGR04255 family)